MKAKMKLLLVMVVIVALLTALFPVTGLAQENKTYFTGKDCPGEITDIGVWTLLGNGSIHIIGLLSWFTETTSDSRLTGMEYNVVYGIMDPVTESGPTWGTVEVVNAGGSWSGQVVGREENGSFTLNGLLHGSGGYDGLVADWGYRPIYDEEGCAQLTGYIVETGAGD